MKNTKLLKAYLTIILVSFSLISFAQNSPKEIVSKFFTDYKNEGASKALDNLYSNNKWMNRATDAITQLKQQLGTLDEDYVGKYYGYELIVEKKLSDSFILMSYLVKFDRQPIRFTFQFYKPDNEWRTHSFKYDGSIDDEIEESAKVYYLDLKN
ncbi:hypothetical protein UMM65_10945 [Aureibaculum sp. 2210JD6-5]|uniref:hypothetical protein n=1 Tax=Aureibaculum sp. 2210JD6-5 TaxID=3103957 RepID=UPI002AADEFAD|nr:hypothetical protein [Aureibaculum sp. 2210JD6-5]MDY7395762.1 hypothetical protein [Aureibaculum sp. 2210JD6-5]